MISKMCKYSRFYVNVLACWHICVNFEFWPHYESNGNEYLIIGAVFRFGYSNI